MGKGNAGRDVGEESRVLVAEVVVLCLGISCGYVAVWVLLLGLDGCEDGREWFRGFVRFHEDASAFAGTLFAAGGESHDRVGVAMRREGDIYSLVRHDGVEVGSVPFFAGRKGVGTTANDKGLVSRDMAHEFKGRGLRSEGGYS